MDALPQKDTAVKIAIISDIHIGEKARSADLCPYKPAKKIFEDGFLAAFRKFASTESICADYLIVAGDISTRALPTEFQLASKVIFDIARALKVKKDRIVFVPGNHDVDWEVMKLAVSDGSPLRRQQRFDPIARPKNTVFTAASSRCTGQLFDEPYLALWDYGPILFVGYNSAWHDDPNVTNHYGFIDPSHVDELDKQLAKISNLANKIKIFFVHHHPISYTKRIRDVDLSQMQHADVLLDLLFKYDFDFLIHGHKHLPNINPYYTHGASSIVVFGAGSFSVYLESWLENTSNLFHLISIEGRDSEDNCLNGLVRSWAYTQSHGWHPSEVRDGIDHKHPFGKYVHPRSLAKELSELCKTLLRGKNWVRWSEIEKQKPNYRHINITLRRKALGEVATMNGWEAHDLEGDDPILLGPENPGGKP